MRRLITAFMVPVLVLAFVGVAMARTPMQQVQGVLDNVFSILKNTEKSDDVKRAELRDLVLSSLDHEKIIRRLLGPQLLQKSTKEQREEFMALSFEILQRNQINLLTLSSDIVITLKKEKIDPDGDLAVVSANIKTREKNIPVDFKMHLVDGEWKVYDYSIVGASYMEDQAMQYSRRLSKVGDFETLLQVLRNLIGSWQNKPLSTPQGG